VRIWLQKMMDTAIAALDGTHFHIAEPVRRVEAMIAPPGSAAAPYYTRPSLDFSRPGRTWLPTLGETRFPLWGLISTWYHEGVPGHHLQLAQWAHLSDRLSAYQTSVGSVSGNTEGWALYAERLMAELGYLDDPADRLGMLDGQRMRAARVVLDLGVHLGKRNLEDTGIWDHDYALAFMRRNVNMADEFVKFEVNRYLGWPGQAPSYKVGQRIWEQIRAEAQQRDGADFSFKDFHKRALDLGGVGLDTLKSVLLS
jgi:uncharacterized protein (DUF885 family)